MTTDRARKAAARRRMAATGETYTQALRRMTSGPVVTTLQPDGEGLDRRAWQWGRVDAVDARHWTVTVLPAGDMPEFVARSAPLVPVEYLDPVTWEPAVTELVPVAYRRPGQERWLWAENGWAVDDPGEIADPAVPPAPSTQLPYAVAEFHSSRDRWGLDYFGSQPAWSVSSWCESLEAASRLAHGLTQTHPFNWHPRVQVWGPGPDGRRARLLQLDTPEPHVYQPGPTSPAAGRPQAPPPGDEPAWAEGLHEMDRAEYQLRGWSPSTSWTTLGWFTCRNAATIAAQGLRVGRLDSSWPYGDVWGPEWVREPGTGHLTGVRAGRSCFDRYPDAYR